MMAIYEVDELTFEVPDGYVDKTINVFLPPSAALKGEPLNIVLTRDALPEEPLGPQVARMLKDFESKMPGAKVLGHRERSVGALPGREARVHAVHSKVPVYQRQFFVRHYGALLTFIVTSARAQSAKCDAIAERLLGSLRLRKQ